MKQVDEEDVTVGGASGVTLPDATTVLNAEEYASSAAAAAPQEDNEGPSDAEIELPPGTGFPWGTGLPLGVCQSLSYWLQQVRIDPLLDHRSTAELPPDTDTVIIGSGMTGTLVAKHYLETFPNKKVVVLEARQFCSGATGRNAGHCKPDQWRHYEKFAKAYGHDQAVKIMENEQVTWKALVEYVQENNVDCDLWVGDTMDVPVDEEVARLAKEVFERYKAAGGKVDHIKVTQDPAEAARISRIKSAKACYAWQASTLQPWKLTAHIMRENIKNGVNLQTGTLVKSISSGTGPRKWRVHTKRGDIDCDTIVHATNAYSAALEPSLRGIITPKPHLCNRAIPPQGLSGSKAIQNSYGILLPHGAIITINPRSTTDGTMLFGGSSPGQQEFDGWVEHNPAHGTDDSFGNIQFVIAPMKCFAEAEFEGWNDPPAGTGEGFDYSWSGIIGLSADGVPFIGQVPEKPGQWICAGHHGHGMARIFTAAPALVKLMRGAEWSDTGLPDVYRMTPERLRRLASRESASAIAVI